MSAPDLDGEVDTPFRVLHPLVQEVDIGDDPQDILLIFLVVLPCLLVGRAEEDLRPGLEPEQLVGDVYTFGEQPLRLVEDLRVEQGEKGGVELHVVFDQDDHLDAHGLRVVFNVETVFDVLDCGDDEPVVPLPDEDPLEDRRIVVGDDILLFPVVVRKEDDGEGEPRFADTSRKADDVHVLDVERGDDQVEMCTAPEQVERLGPAGDMGDVRGMAEVQILELPENQLIEASILFKEVVVVEARDEENVADLDAHQLLKALDAARGDFLDFQVFSAVHGERRGGISTKGTTMGSEGQVADLPQRVSTRNRVVASSSFFCESMAVAFSCIREAAVASGGTPPPPRGAPRPVRGRGVSRLQTSPWSSMALATLRNPAIFAPVT